MVDGDLPLTCTELIEVDRLWSGVWVSFEIFFCFKNVATHISLVRYCA